MSTLNDVGTQIGTDVALVNNKALVSMQAQADGISGFIDRELDLDIPETGTAVGIKNRFVKAGDTVYDTGGTLSLDFSQSIPNTRVETSTTTTASINAGDYVVLDRPELVTNGTFDVDTSGWTAYNSTIVQEAGSIRITGTSTSKYPMVVQYIPTVVGSKYTILFDIKEAGFGIVVVGANDLSPQTGAEYYYPNAIGSYKCTFTAAYSNTQIKLIAGSISSSTALFDNISVKQVDEVYRAKVNTITGSLLTDTVKFEVRDQLGVTNQIAGFIAVDDVTGAVTTEAEIMFNDITEEEANLDRDAGFTKNGFSIVEDGLLSKGTKKYIPVGVLQC